MPISFHSPKTGMTKVAPKWKTATRRAPNPWAATVKRRKPKTRVHLPKSVSRSGKSLNK